jgi:hypothetical protein
LKSKFGNEPTYHYAIVDGKRMRVDNTTGQPWRYADYNKPATAGMSAPSPEGKVAVSGGTKTMQKYGVIGRNLINSDLWLKEHGLFVSRTSVYQNKKPEESYDEARKRLIEEKRQAQKATGTEKMVASSSANKPASFNDWLEKRADAAKKRPNLPGLGSPHVSRETREQVASAGGQATVERYGQEHMSEIASKRDSSEVVAELAQEYNEKQKIADDARDRLDEVDEEQALRDNARTPEYDTELNKLKVESQRPKKYEKSGKYSMKGNPFNPSQLAIIYDAIQIKVDEMLALKDQIEKSMK